MPLYSQALFILLLKVNLVKVKVNFIFSMIQGYSNKKPRESRVLDDILSSEPFDQDYWEKIF